MEVNHFRDFFDAAVNAADRLDVDRVRDLAEAIHETRRVGGRVFVLGNGGSAANASHFVNDLRKVLGVEAYAPTDGASELTARANDDGYETVFEEYLAVSQLVPRDTVIFLSGSGESVNLCNALQYAIKRGAKTAAILGRAGSTVGSCVDTAVVVPLTNHWMETSETLQQLVWHAIVTHPGMKP